MICATLEDTKTGLLISLNCKIICKGRKSRPENLGICKAHTTNVVLLFSGNNNNLKSKTFHKSSVRQITTMCYLTSINFSQSVFLHPKFGHGLQTLKPVTGIFHSPNWIGLISLHYNITEFILCNLKWRFFSIFCYACVSFYLLEQEGCCPNIQQHSTETNWDSPSYSWIFS